MYDITKFQQGLDYIGVELSKKQIDQLLRFYELLIEKNKVMNLTAITEFDEVIEKHFIDSMLLAKAIKIEKGIKVIDLGTGAGFPGIPLKIAFPDIYMLLADSLNKRIKFLNEVIDELELNSGSACIETIHGRAEDLGRNPEYREQFDFCVSRAVANLSTLSEYCLPFVKKGGYFIAYKSGNVDSELLKSQKAVHMLGGEIEKCEKVMIPGTDIERSFVIIHKKAPISKKYPRKAGTPSKEPLS